MFLHNFQSALLPSTPTAFYRRLILSLSLSALMAIFPGGPGLSITGMSPFWILLELRMMEAVVITGAKISPVGD